MNFNIIKLDLIKVRRGQRGDQSQVKAHAKEANEAKEAPIISESSTSWKTGQ